MNIFKTLSHYVYLAQWFLRARFLGRRAPLQTVLFITDKCNLRCKHCSVYGSAGYKQRSFEDIVADMQYSYEQGSRFIDLEVVSRRCGKRKSLPHPSLKGGRLDRFAVDRA